MLPADFPDWRTCYQYFRQWSERPGPGQDSILERVLKKIGWRGPTKQWSEKADQLLYRGLPERQEQDTADSKGYDAGKKVSGIKRHLAVDTPGLPHAIHVTTANVTDRAGVWTILRTGAASVEGLTPADLPRQQRFQRDLPKESSIPAIASWC